MDGTRPIHQVQEQDHVIFFVSQRLNSPPDGGPVEESRALSVCNLCAEHHYQRSRAPLLSRETHINIVHT